MPAEFRLPHHALTDSVRKPAARDACLALRRGRRGWGGGSSCTPDGRRPRPRPGPRGSAVGQCVGTCHKPPTAAVLRRTTFAWCAGLNLTRTLWPTSMWPLRSWMVVSKQVAIVGLHPDRRRVGAVLAEGQDRRRPRTALAGEAQLLHQQLVLRRLFGPRRLWLLFLVTAEHRTMMARHPAGSACPSGLAAGSECSDCQHRRGDEDEVHN